MPDPTTTDPAACVSNANNAKSPHLCNNCRVLMKTDGVFAGPLGLSAAQRPSITDFFSLFEHPDLKAWKWYPFDYDVTDSFPDLPALRASGLGGCPFCQRLRLALRSREFARISRAERQRSGYVYIKMSIWAKGSTSDGSGNHLVSFLEVVARMTGNWHRIIFPIQAGGGQGPPTFPTNSGDYLSPASSDWMLRSLNQCENHDHVTIDPSFCPARLIDVREGSIKLALREDILNSLPNGSTNPQYTALSYVWGPPTEARRQLKTNSSTLPERCVGISENDLPAAVRDAVRVTRALSIPYLWVDALCILQDMSENQDWERECAVMDKIYGNAKLTICAATSRSCSDGFLARPTYLPSLQIPFGSPDGSPTPYRTYRIQSFVVDSKQQHMPASLEECNVWESSWCKRGWTYQESFLSARCLTFGWLGLLFSCPTSHQIQGDISRPGPSDIQRSQYLDSSFLSKDEITRRSEIYKAWAVDVLPEYSLRRGDPGLSRITDCLPALSGLATKFSQLLGVPESDYVAGLWQQDLFRSLIWIPVIGHDKDPPDFNELIGSFNAEPRIAPSWSWASSAVAYREFSLGVWRPGTINVLGYTLRHLASFRPESEITASTTPHGDNLFGEISSGVLRVTTKVCTLPSSPLAREQRLLDIGTITSGPRIVYLDYRYFATCMFDWNGNLVSKRWRETPLFGPFSKVRMVLLASAELTTQAPKDSITGVEDETLETQDHESDGNAEKAIGTNRDDNCEDLENPAKKGTRDSNSELDWDGEMDNSEDRFYTGDRCATGLLVVPVPRQQGKYYRVGVFFSEPRGRGGLQAFQSLEDITLEII